MRSPLRYGKKNGVEFGTKFSLKNFFALSIALIVSSAFGRSERYVYYKPFVEFQSYLTFAKLNRDHLKRERC